MFESLSERFTGFVRKISGKGTISESNVRDALEDVRTALLEADVHQDVVRTFTDDVMRESIGRNVTKSLQPGQEMIGIIHERLVALMKADDGRAEGSSPIEFVAPGPTVVMLCGLQGSGKTTTAGKIAAWCRKRGLNVLVAAADLQRPAAVEQLRQVIDVVKAEGKGGSIVEFYAEPDKVAEYGKAVGVAIQVCQRALRTAREGKYDVLILDTAGRLHVNDELMRELQGVKTAVAPHQILLVVDAMTGQDALRSAKSFHERLHVDGLILTKFDSETRGGAALSAKFVTGAPVRFVGTGEKFEALEEFHPERVAGRILGMGDVVSLVEKAKEEVDEAEAERLAAKLAEGKLSMEDFISQMRSIRRMGPIKQIMGMLPGVGPMLKGLNVDEKQLDHLEAIYNSMTPREREDVKRLDKSRTKRIARGSGTKEQDVNRFTDSFLQMQKLTASMAGGGVGAKMKMMREMSKSGAMPGMQGMTMKGSTQTESHKSKFKKRK